MNKFPLSQPPSPLVFYKWQVEGRAPAQTGLEEVWAKLIWKGRSPAIGNPNPGAAQTVQLPPPWKPNLWVLGVHSGAIQTWLRRNTFQEEISLAAFGPELPPQSLAEHAVKPAYMVPVPVMVLLLWADFSPILNNAYFSILPYSHIFPTPWPEMPNREPPSWYRGATSLITTDTQ